MGNFEIDFRMIFQFFLSAFLIFSTLQVGMQSKFEITEDLNPRLKIFKDNEIQNSHAVHLALDLSQQRGHYLNIESKKNFYVFINSAFAFKGIKQLKLNADSLRSRYSNSIFISLYQKNGINDLSVKWAVLRPVDELYNPKRPKLGFSNFILIASLSLAIFFTILFHTNPQLTLDYLNLTKLFYLRDREENLFYLLCSLLASLALITEFHFSHEGLSFMESALETTGEYALQWILLALGISGVLMIKLVFLALIATLYGWEDVTGFQFFNFIRTLILSLAIIAILSLSCFSFGIAVNYYTLLKAGCILLIMGAGLLYFKLQARTTFRSFHLFSYLCATEIFPLVILIKLILF
jgi:hypothetical protein